MWGWAEQSDTTGENDTDIVTENPHLMKVGDTPYWSTEWRYVEVSPWRRLVFNSETCSDTTRLKDWSRTCESPCACPGSAAVLVWLGTTAAQVWYGRLIVIL